MLRKLIESHLSKCPSIESRWFQFATVDLEGFPAVRTLVFRGFHSDNTIVLVTDLRSEKVLHLKKNPVAEICWYFKETKTQIRIQTRCKIETNDQVRLKYWKELSPATRAQFSWPRVDGLDETRDYLAKLDLEDPMAQQAFTNFVVVLCEAVHVKILELSIHPPIPKSIKL